MGKRRLGDVLFDRVVVEELNYSVTACLHRLYEHWFSCWSIVGLLEVVMSCM